MVSLAQIFMYTHRHWWVMDFGSFWSYLRDLLVKNVHHNTDDYYFESKNCFFPPFQHFIAFKEQPFVSSAAARTITKKEIRHQQNCIIPMMTSVVAISIFHYFPSQVFFDVKYTSPLSTQRSLLFKCSPFQKSRMLTPPNRAKSPRHRVACLPYGSQWILINSL